MFGFGNGTYSGFFVDHLVSFQFLDWTVCIGISKLDKRYKKLDIKELKLKKNDSRNQDIEQSMILNWAVNDKYNCAASFCNTKIIVKTIIYYIAHCKITK